MGRGRAGVAVALWWLAGSAGAVWLELAPTATKCVSEEIQSRVVVIGDYSVLSKEHLVRPKIGAKVTSPYGKVLHHADNVTQGQFAFTTGESGIYLACFWVEAVERGTVIKLSVDWRVGIAAKDWDAIAKKEKLEGVALELVKLESAVQAIHTNLFYLRLKSGHDRCE
ncbi:hypothetical protein ACP70R_014862 [Stipagrostis hirtigluma subsp. patula]